MKRLASIACSASLLVACGGTAPRPASAPMYEAPAYATPSSATKGEAAPTAPAGGAAGAPSTSTMAQPAPSPAQPAPPSFAPPPASAARDEPARSGARDLEAAEREVASSDCGTACRALGSMERSVVFLCMSSASDGEGDHCANAKGRLVSARRRVRATCGSCPGGPSVEPDAPVPSRR